MPERNLCDFCDRSARFHIGAESGYLSCGRHLCHAANLVLDEDTDLRAFVDRVNGPVGAEQ